MMEIFNWLINEEGGQGMFEYSLIITLVVIALISVLQIFGDKTVELYDKSLEEIPF